MAKVNSLKIKMVYEDATSRNYVFNGIADEQIPEIRDRIKDINEKIFGGYDDGNAFKSIFVSNNGAEAVEISEAKITTTEQEVIYSAS